MNIVDIKACVDIVKGKNIMVAVDNTFASPYLQNPLESGCRHRDAFRYKISKWAF